MMPAMWQSRQYERHRNLKSETLRIARDLIAEYRDWSWEARCQLSELVERALATYRELRPC